MRTVVLSLMLLLLAACGAAQDGGSTRANESSTAQPAVDATSLAASIEAASEYELAAKTFVAAVEAGASPDDLQPQAQRLLDLGVAVIPDYVAVYPACGEYLQAAAGIADKWSEMSPDAIEAGYHKDGALPPKPQDVDCYHMKDLVVHPATALALLVEDEVDFEQLRMEIYEVIAHAQAVRLTLEKYVE